jgi:hypothetical protein
MTGNLPAPRVPVDLAARARLDDRTTELLRREPVRTVWQRRVDPGAHVWVRPDDMVVVGDELVAIASGETVHEPAWPFLDLQPWSRQLWEPYVGYWADWPAVLEEELVTEGQFPDNCYARWWGDLLVVAKLPVYDLDGSAPSRDRLAVEARRGDRSVWSHDVTDPRAYAAWLSWLSCRGGVLESMSRQPDPIHYPDLETGACRWSLPADHRRWRPDRAVPADPGHVLVTFNTNQPGVVGIDADNGQVCWRVDTPDGTLPVDVAAGVGHLAVCAFPAASPPDQPYLTIETYNRSTGQVMWSHRWPWDGRSGAPHPAAVCALAGADSGEIIVTQEGGFLRARTLAEGTLLWSCPVRAIPGVVPGAGRPSYSPERDSVAIQFECTNRDHRPAWVWLHQMTRFSFLDRDRRADIFVHAATGRTATLSDAFHLTATGLVLALSDDTLTCLALPEIPRHV